MPNVQPGNSHRNDGCGNKRNLLDLPALPPPTALDYGGSAAFKAGMVSVVNNVLTLMYSHGTRGCMVAAGGGWGMGSWGWPGNGADNTFGKSLVYVFFPAAADCMGKKRHCCSGQRF
jgi:hypothetical protein